MKILTINASGIPDSSSSNLLDANVFQDYEALVVDPENLDVLWGYNRIKYDNHEKNALTSETGQILSNLNYKRSKQVTGLLKLGGVVVCFMQPLRNYYYEYYYQGEERQSNITNYDWLPDGIYS